MNLTERDIDWIVAEVVRRLATLSGERQSDKPTLISDKVITLETLKKYHQQTELVILPRAIVTPAAKDELKKRNIRLIRQGESGATNTTNKTTSGKLLAANLGADYQAKTLAQLVASFGATIEQHPATNFAAVIADHAHRVVRESQKAIWFTSTPAHAVCLANRHAGVWAVQGFDERALAESLKTTRANVLVVDPKGKSQYMLKRILETFT